MAGLGSVAAGMSSNSTPQNPYVGPRTFQTAEGDLFFGREREARDLQALVISERLVLFYAQSGAGKSSLINTRLIPGLAAQGFEVLPVGRLSGQTELDVAADNIFVYNLLLSLHQQEQIPAVFTKIDCLTFLDNLVSAEGKFYYDEQYDFSTQTEFKPRVLIIDQFEEILTTNVQAWPQRTTFFQQISRALEIDDQLWVVLAMRVDYVAALDPYVDYVPGQLRARYYMQPMGYQAALEAVQKPAEKAGRPFTAETAQTLIDDLRRVKVHGKDEPQLGQFVEPVQLQVVCYQLWENLSQESQPARMIGIEALT
ncbi:MAG: hypothetical protein R3264_07905, partial [Anaerolineae bacterium]|nr:hypothetical protein [Anaerolineae bacterium]